MLEEADRKKLQTHPRITKWNQDLLKDGANVGKEVHGAIPSQFLQDQDARIFCRFNLVALAEIKRSLNFEIHDTFSKRHASDFCNTSVCFGRSNHDVDIGVGKELLDMVEETV